MGSNVAPRLRTCPCTPCEYLWTRYMCNVTMPVRTHVNISGLEARHTVLLTAVNMASACRHCVKLSWMSIRTICKSTWSTHTGAPDHRTPRILKSIQSVSPGLSAALLHHVSNIKSRTASCMSPCQERISPAGLKPISLDSRFSEDNSSS